MATGVEISFKKFGQQDSRFSPMGLVPTVSIKEVWYAETTL